MLTLEQGRWLRRSDEVVLGRRLAHEKRLGVGDSLRLGSRDFTVVGIGTLRGIGIGDPTTTAYLDYAALRQQAGFGDVVNMLAVETARPAETRGRIAELGSYAIASPDELVAEAQEVFAADLIGHWIVNLLTLAIAALFVNNMLSRSVSERRLEFATLRAIGVPGRTVLLAVALEAVLIALAGTLVGIALSTLLGEVWLNGQVAPQYGYERFYAADPRLFLEVFGLALGLGLVAGLLPARAATRVDPGEVLREA
jgi:putative ABC transport system permease protein